MVRPLPRRRRAATSAPRCEPDHRTRAPERPTRGTVHRADARAGVTYIEPFRRRVRAIKDGRTVVDSERVLLVHRPGRPPTYAFPAGDVDGAGRRGRARRPRLRHGRLGRRRRLVRGGRAGLRAPAQPVPPGRLPALRGAGSGSRPRASRWSTPRTPSPSTRLRSSLASTSTRVCVRIDLLERERHPDLLPVQGHRHVLDARIGDDATRRRRLELRGPAPRVAPLGALPELRRHPGHGRARPAGGRLTRRASGAATARRRYDDVLAVDVPGCPSRRWLRRDRREPVLLGLHDPGALSAAGRARRSSSS